MNFKSLVSSLFLILTLSANSQEAIINGTAAEWKGLKARLIIEKDPLSNLEEVLDTTTIDENGVFALKTEIKKTQRYWIVVNRFRAPIYLGPNDSLDIALLPNPQNQLISTWQKGSFQYAFVNSDSSNLNSQISKFDTEYYNFFLENASLLGTSQMKKAVETFESKYQLKTEDDFIGNYIKYSIAEMKLSSGFNKTTIFHEYLDSTNLALNNPAWLSFYLTFYADYFASFDNRFKGATVYNRFNNGMKVSTLDSLMSTDPFLGNDSLIALTALHGVEEVISDPKYSKRSLLDICEFYFEKTEHSELKKIAEGLIQKIRGKSNSISALPFLPESFKESTSKDDERPIVFMVTRPSIKSDKKERLLMLNLVTKYPEIIRAAEISIEEEQAETSWESSYMADPYDLLTSLEIFAFPHYIWVSPSGVVEENPVERPSQGLEVKLYKIQVEKEKSNTLKVGQ